MVKAGGIEVALLRRLGENAQAKERLVHWSSIDPPNSFLRHEAVKLGHEDPALWQHLARDPERVLELVVDYMGLGMYDETVELLARQYPSVGVVGEPGAVLPQDYPLVAYYRGFCREKLGQSGRSDFAAASGQSIRYVFPNRPETLNVLGKALQVNPRDGTAHFLLGLLYLSGGQADAALQEWEQARLLNPALPVLHRNLGMTLLHARADPKRAAEVFVEGMSADPLNLDLYLGMDQSLSLLGASPEQRLEALRRYPTQDALPTMLLHKLALTLLECGHPEEADSLFSNRTFIREEFGTNIREIYLEVQLQKALALARKGQASQAGTLVESMNHEVPGLSFTRDGLDGFIQGARFQYYLGKLESVCGNPLAARQHWVRASQAQDYRQLCFGYLAAKELGGLNQEEWQARLGKAAAAAGSYVASGGHFPGIATYARGLLLRTLGQVEQGTRLLKEAFYLPDKRMSHYLSRAALQGSY
jgi:tetratricopeptide (TPR) repeat protein